VNVFLVEDSPLLRPRLEALLASIAGARLTGQAAGAQAAIAAILATVPDAVLLDIHLEEGNGFDVLKALHKSAPQVAVYVLTNFPTEPYRRKAESLGARGFFDKSGELGKLREALAAREG
jgi:DNA-binding NarL/FixJ family response regulator